MSSIETTETRLEALLRRLADLRLMRLPQGCELSPPMVGMLFLVYQKPGRGVLEISDELGVTPPTVSVGVRKLVKNGWLEQRRDPDDKRAKPLFLTEKSEALLEELRQHQRVALKLFLSSLEVQEQETFLQLFDKAMRAVEDAHDKEQ